ARGVDLADADDAAGEIEEGGDAAGVGRERDADEGRGGVRGGAVEDEEVAGGEGGAGRREGAAFFRPRDEGRAVGEAGQRLLARRTERRGDGEREGERPTWVAVTDERERVGDGAGERRLGGGDAMRGRE